VSAVPSHVRPRRRARAVLLTLLATLTLSLVATAVPANAASNTWWSSHSTGIDSSVDTPVVAAPPPTAAVAVAVKSTTNAAAKTSAVHLAARARIVRTTFAQRVLTEARKHYGAPYRWGATGPSRFDCSGFTGYVFRKVGKHLPRTSRSQYAHTIHVSHAHKRLGDLIFRYSSSGRIYHVGIYAGGGKMINATHTGDVVRTSSIGGRYRVGRVR
jgi:cell wall-associated NlpC family hydrolase